MTKDEICKCSHAGRDHEKICLVATCPCVKAERMEPQPFQEPAKADPTPISGYPTGIVV